MAKSCVKGQQGVPYSLCLTFKWPLRPLHPLSAELATVLAVDTPHLPFPDRRTCVFCDVRELVCRSLAAPSSPTILSMFSRAKVS